MLGSIISLRAVGLAVVLVAAVLVIAWLYSRNAKKRRKRPGQLVRYRVPTLNAVTCRGLLGHAGPEDLFTTALESAPAGGWYMHFTGHPATGQALDTLFLLQFEDDAPAVFSLRFVREAFGMREPVISEVLLDQFFAQKLGAARLDGEETPGLS